jgi:hypothetical protein
MQIMGCDLHARQQTLAMLDTATGEVVNSRPRRQQRAGVLFHASRSGAGRHRSPASLRGDRITHHGRSGPKRCLVGNTLSMKRKRPELVGVTQVEERSRRDAIRVPWGRCVRAPKKYQQNFLKRSASLEITPLPEMYGPPQSCKRKKKNGSWSAPMYSAFSGVRNSGP